jgi:protein phosphatase
VYLLCSDGLSDMVGHGTIESIVREHRDDVAGAARALVHAANRAGGEDNITAVLFAIVEGEEAPQEPEEKTREHISVVAEEDTLHPEDGVLPPPPAAPREDTMVVPASAIPIPATETASETETDPEFEAGLGRRLLALLVIAALCALIVVLVWWGLAR